MAANPRPPSVGHAVFLAPTAPVEAVLWGLALVWLAYFVDVPDVIYARLHAAPLLQAKALWVYMAAGAVVLPPLVLVNGARWRWLLHVSRYYALVFWWGLFGLTAYLTPTLLPFWGTALVGGLAAVWLMMRFITRDAARGTA